MVKRKKRLLKGISSLENQIEIHRKKLKQAQKEGEVDLEKYYEKEIDALKKRKLDREDKM